jgi:hypothetical protein
MLKSEFWVMGDQRSIEAEKPNLAKHRLLVKAEN